MSRQIRTFEILIALVLSILSFSLKADGNCSAFYAVLDAQIDAKNSGHYRTMDRIYDLKRKEKNPGKYFVKLLDYYLGSAGGAVLEEFITSEGKEILPHLEMKLGTPVACEKRYVSICTKGKEHRDKRISRMISAINSGKVLKVIE